MIVVIADDLSGAAELAGAARRHGLTAEVQMRFTPDVPSRVVCVDSEGRARSESAAAADMRELLQTVISSRPEWIFFKFDSVLRGNIAAQLAAALDVGGHARAVLITANPARGRTIRNGHYFVGGVPLHLTQFAGDPEFPCSTSSVRELLRGDLSRIVTPDIESTADLDQWVHAADPTTLTAGSAEFFEALLRIRAGGAHGGGRAVPQMTDGAPASEDREKDMPVLMVCGSRASWLTRVAEAEQRGIIAYDILDDVIDAAATLGREGALLLGIGERIETGTMPRAELLGRLADAVATICGRVRTERLLLEGGATAAAVIRRMGWSRLICEDGVGEGVGTLRPPGPGNPLVLIKPGSYPWPAGAM